MRRAHDDLLPARITSRHIHVLANHSVALEQLPETSLLQSSDVVHSLDRGVALGGATGALLGLVALVVSRRGHRRPLWVEYGPIRVKRSLDMTHMQKTEWPAKST